MDYIEEYASQAAQLYILAKPYLTSILNLLFSIQKYVELLLLPHVNALAQWAYTSPSIITVGVFFLLLFIISQIIHYIRRLITFWIRLIARLTFWAVIIALIAMLWHKGFEKSLRDLESWAREISRVYWREYERWERYGNPPLQRMYHGRKMGNSRYTHSFR